MRARSALAVAIAMVGISLAAASDAPTIEGEDLASLVSSTRAAYGLPGVAAALVSSGGVETSVDGVRRAGFEDRVQPADRFHIGSNAKALTATLIAKLVEEGRLTWQTRPAEVLARQCESIDPGFTDVTLEQLLTHRAGIQPFTAGAEFSALPPFEGSPREQRAAFAAWLLGRPPHGTQGTYEYSNAGYGLAAAIAEAAAEEAWEDLLTERVLAPLGITAAFGWPARPDAEQPWGHWPLGDSFFPCDPNGGYELSPLIAPAGDVSMSVADYARFVQMHLEGLRGERTLLAPETALYLHTPVGAYAPGGWLVQRLDDGSTVSAHMGSAGTFVCYALVWPARDCAAVAITNAGGPRAEEAAVRLVERLAGAGLEAGAARVAT